MWVVGGLEGGLIGFAWAMATAVEELKIVVGIGVLGSADNTNRLVWGFGVGVLQIRKNVRFFFF